MKFVFTNAFAPASQIINFDGNTLQTDCCMTVEARAPNDNQTRDTSRSVHPFPFDRHCAGDDAR